MKTSPHEVEVTLAALAQVHVTRHAKVFRKLPAGVPAKAVVRAAVRCLDQDQAWMLRELHGAQAKHVRALLDAFARRADFTSNFLRLLQPHEVDDAAMLKAWKLGLSSCLWHRPDLKLKPERTRILKLARHPQVGPAVVGAVAVSRDVPMPMLAVAVAQGSVALDALLPHVAAAERDGARLELLREAARVAPDDFTAFRVALDTMLARRSAQSPLVAVARTLGLSSTTVKGTYAVSSARRLLRLEFDTGAHEWVRPWVWKRLTSGGLTRGEHPPLPPDAMDLPKWLRALDPDWERPGGWKGLLTKANRTRFLAWLESA